MLLKRQVNSHKFFKFSKSSKFSKFSKFFWQFSNMSKLVKIQYDMNCYDSYDSQTCLNMFKQTCLNLFRFNMIQIVLIHTILKHVQTCLNLFRFNMIWIVTIHMILKHVYTIKWQNPLEFEKMAHEKLRQSDSLDCFEQVEQSKKSGKRQIMKMYRKYLLKV